MAGSTLGDWLQAMVELRRNKAQVAEFNAEQQSKGMAALGEGIGGFLGNIGKGMPSREDLAYNQVANRATPPRAVPVDPALASAVPTLRPGQIPYDQIPITGNPFTGGKAGFDALSVLDRSDIAREKLATQGMLNEARIAHMGALEGFRQTDDERRAAELALKQEREGRLSDAAAAKTANDLTTRAAKSMNDTTQKYRDKVKETTTYNNHVALTLHNMATAKTDEDWQKNVDLLTNHYNAIDSMGYKLPFPEIPPSPSQRQAAAAATQTATDLTPQSFWHPFGTSQADIDKAKAAAAAMPGSYQYPGMQDYQRADPGEPPSGNLADYMPPSAAPQGQPSQAGGAAPEGLTVTNAQGVKMKKVNGKWVVVQ